jgi:hypothetical protein
MRVVEAAVLAASIASAGLACGSLTERKTSAVGTPTASQDADIIVDRYRNDPKLGDELFNDKTVEINAFRVDGVEGTTLEMTDRGYTLRLDGVAKPSEIKVGDVLVLICEGDGLSGEKIILFEGCVSK